MAPGKKISLELGGKSPIVVYENSDLDSVVEGVVDAIWFNQASACKRASAKCLTVGCALQGQVCSAGSRLLAQESIADRLIKKLKARIDHFRIRSAQRSLPALSCAPLIQGASSLRSHPLEKDVDMGALVDKSQFDTISGAKSARLVRERWVGSALARLRRARPRRGRRGVPGPRAGAQGGQRRLWPAGRRLIQR